MADKQEEFILDTAAIFHQVQAVTFDSPMETTSISDVLGIAACICGGKGIEVGAFANLVGGLVLDIAEEEPTALARLKTYRGLKGGNHEPMP